MLTALEILLFVIILLFLFTYIGYPLSLMVLSRFSSKKTIKAPIEPSVSIIIAAYNEEANIRSKIESTLAFEYPEEKKEIIVVSDGSTDGTNSIVREFAQDGKINFIEMKERGGKECAQNEAVKVAGGEVIVFTDASVYIKPGDLKKIVQNFADPSVGCVTSEDKLCNDDEVELSEKPYISYDTKIRRIESEIDSVVGLSGSFFAARAELCTNLCSYPPVDSDFRLVMNCKEHNLRAINDPEVCGEYRAVAKADKEFQRKVRTVLRGMTGMWQQIRYLNPMRYGLFAYQLFAHKVLRWISPFFLGGIFIVNILLIEMHAFYLYLFFAQLMFYGVASAGIFFSHTLPLFKLLAIPSFFLHANLAVLAAWYFLLKGKKVVFWESSSR